LKKNLKKYLISSAIIILSSCAGQVPPPAPALITNQDEFVRQVKASNPMIHTLKGKARIEVTTKDRSYKFKAGVMINKDGYMFIETYGFGIPQGYASLFDDRLSVVFPGSKELYVGSSSSTLTKLLKVNVSLNELFEPLLRRIQISEDAPPKSQITSTGYIITDFEKTKFYVNANKWIDKIERKMGFLIEYGEPWTRKLDYPKSVRLSYEYQSIKVTYDELVINEPIPNEAFQMKIPTEGYKIIPIE
jgi:hypothetical protein